MRGVGAENAPLLPLELDCRDISRSVSRNGLLEVFGSVRFGRAVGVSGNSSFGEVFAAISCFGAGAGGG
jgi:hypothetical protein